MQGIQQARRRNRHPRPEEDGSPGAQTQPRTLPRWESFPLEDRHRLVCAILQAARHQVEMPSRRSQPRR
jgi:hypothetical protein